ncbi:hypothetical protein DNTS_013420 [Danionella cerebrum]|uniref:Multiple C2 and transmembrane domain-containing protein 1 n=1 Tax=Danionella cerebrum TaxID=2873325 RepID=A0A553Q6Y2_9TELE|nr:hypothetical protein DNTS_013420 [Danionella translucida]
MCCKWLSVFTGGQQHALACARPRAPLSLSAFRCRDWCCCCWTGTMEEKRRDESPRDPQSPSSYQRRMWRTFQEKTKPFLSPKLGSERRRSGDGKKESGLWMFKRKKKQVLDRVFSSSQPNLCSSTPTVLSGDRTLCVEPDSSSGRGLEVSPLVGSAGASSFRKPEISVSAHGSPQLLAAHLAMSQPKSSSLGSSCFEKLVVDSAASSEDELAKHPSDLVSESHFKHKVTREPHPASISIYHSSISHRVLINRPNIKNSALISHVGSSHSC